MDLSHFHGIFTPIVTPLREDQSLDRESLDRLVEHLIDVGVHGIWVMGTTGEFACFDADEREAAVRTVVQAVRERVPVVAGIGDASTPLAIEHGRRAAGAGADALALTPPYYYSNNQDELEAHYRAVNSAVDRPLFLYHIPQNVKVKVEPPVVRRLAVDGVIVGLKDSQNDLQWFRRVAFNAKSDGVDLRCFLGTQALVDVAVQVGGIGAIPGAANVAADAAVGAYEAARRGEYEAAARHAERVMMTGRLGTIVKGASQTGSSLAAMKAVLARRGIIATGTCRAPFRTCTPDEAREADEIVALAEGAAV